MRSPGPGTPNSERRTQLLALVGFVGLCLLVGAVDFTLAGGLPGRTPAWYLSLRRPPGVPPMWIFGPGWAVLSAMIGTAAWLVWQVPAGLPRRRLRLWGWQLLLNAAWIPAFARLHSPVLALAVILALLPLIGLTIRAFAAVRPLAGALMLPYAAWTCYAGYLAAGFMWLNQG